MKGSVSIRVSQKMGQKGYLVCQSGMYKEQVFLTNKRDAYRLARSINPRYGDANRAVTGKGQPEAVTRAKAKQDRILWQQMNASNYRALFSRDSEERIHPTMWGGKHVAEFNKGGFNI